KPERPVILAPPGEPQPDSQERIVIASDPDDAILLQTPVKLICLAKGGKPAPTFEWFHNGEQISANKMTERESRTDGQIIRRVEVSLDRSRIKAGDRLVCMISNKATLKETKLAEQNLRSELLVDIQSPVGKPQITGVGDDVFEEKATLRAVCSATPAGEPRGKLSWKWSDPNKKVSIRHMSEQQFPNGEDRLSNILKLPRLTKAYHGDKLICTASNALNIPRSTGVVVRVKCEFIFCAQCAN
ncbi:hypothetical protein Ciccas_013552, partial [Cichlidogyrus casuarinus]